MALRMAACRFGLWWVHVSWKGEQVFRVRFSHTGTEGDVPARIRQYLRGKPVDLTALKTTATEKGAPWYRVYRAVQEIPYGQTATYGEIAERVGTSPRAVGAAMKRNPTPLIVPCHRVVSRNGIGGFTPDVELKQILLALEKCNK